MIFPEFSGLRCLMMPYVQGEPESIPREYAAYSEIVRDVFIRRGDIGYLTIDESLAHAVDAQAPLRVDALDGHEAHVRALDGFADGLRVRRIVLAFAPAQPVRRHELGRDDAHRVAQGLKLPRPVVRTRARLHADQARRQLGHQLQQRIAPHAGLDSTALPASSTPCTAKTFLARSIPIAIMAMDFPFRMKDR